MLNGDILLFESVVVGDLPEFDEIQGRTSTDQLLDLLWPKHDQGVWSTDGVKAEIKSSEE